MKETQNCSNFVASRKQIQRLGRIVALLKRGDLTMNDILQEFDNTAIHDKTDISCSPRTVRRCIETLKCAYHCPLEYDHATHCYTLINKQWDFIHPAIVSPDELLAIVIGGKLSKDILPPTVSCSVVNAVDEVIRYNSTDDFLASGRIESLKILSNIGQTVSDEIFRTVFEAWRTCRCLLIDYKDNQERHSKRTIEPHALVFYDMQWSIRAQTPDTKEWRTYLASRIENAYIQETKFKPNTKEIHAITPDNYYRFEEVGSVRIKLTKGGLQFAKAHPLRANQSFTCQDANTYILSVPNISIEEMTRWILSHVPGDAVPIAPQTMVNAFKKSLYKIQKLCP